MNVESTQENFAAAWIASAPLYTLSKTVEGESTILSVIFDSNMDFDENRDSVHLSLDGIYLKPGWSFKQEVDNFSQENSDDGMSHITADYYLNIQNLDNPSANKRYLVHTFDLWVPAKNKLPDDSFDFMTEKENKKLLESKLQEAFTHGMAILRNPGHVTGQGAENSVRNRHNPFQKQEQAISDASAAPVTHVAKQDKGTIELTKKNLSIAAIAVVAAIGLSYAFASGGNGEAKDNAQGQNLQAQNNPLIGSNTNDPGAVAALDLTKQTLEGMGLDVSKTGSDLGCLTSN